MPNKWKTYKLGDVISIRGGFSYKGKFIGSGDSLLLGMGCVSHNEKFIFSGARPYSGDCRDVFLQKPGDIVLATRQQSDNLPIIGLPAMVPPELEGKKVIGGTNLFLVNNDSDIDNRYLYWLLKSPDYKNYIKSMSSGTTVRMIVKSDVESYIFSCPDKKERDAIADFLWQIDNKIENNLAINKTLEDMAMALYKHWFVDFGPFQDGEFFDSELGSIPKGWEVKRLGDLIEVINGYAFKSKWFQDFGEKVVKIKNISNNVVDIDNCNCITAEKALEINDKFKIEPGDFLVAMTGAEVGKVGVVPDYQQPLWLNQRVGKLKDKMFVNSSILVGKILQSKEYYEVIQGLAYGSAQPNISASGIENIEICLPKNLEDIQVLIDEFVSSQDQIIHNLSENQSLTKLRDTLLPKLISGEVRLKEFQNQIETVL